MFIDMTFVRSLFTVIALALFIGIFAWTWSARRRQGFDEAAALPFDDEFTPQRQQETRDE